MQCGAPATDEVLKKYTTDQVHLPPPEPEPIGCVLWPILGLAKLISWSAATTMPVRTPLCHKHAHGWFTWSTLEAKAITGDSIILTGVSDEFVQAWAREKQTRHFGQQDNIKVRCQKCRAINSEAARFCDQCGAAI
jgi:hypothetical protein